MLGLSKNPLRALLDRHWPGRFSPQSIPERALLIHMAFDHALEKALERVNPDYEPLTGRDATSQDAETAVKASYYQCGQVARDAEDWLLSIGNVTGVGFISLQGHYALFDRRTGLIHDLECPQGCRRRTQLPIWNLSQDLAHITAPPENLEAEIAIIFRRYANAWLHQRHQF